MTGSHGRDLRPVLPLRVLTKRDLREFIYYPFRNHLCVTSEGLEPTLLKQGVTEVTLTPDQEV